MKRASARLASRAGSDADDRVYQSFLRGYLDSVSGRGTVADAQPAQPCAALIQAATVESRELRRSIDACGTALSHLPSLPEAEQAQLRSEARASLQALSHATGVWLSRLTALRPSLPGAAPPPGPAAAPSPSASAAADPPADRPASAAAPPTRSRPRKTRSRR